MRFLPSMESDTGRLLLARLVDMGVGVTLTIGLLLVAVLVLRRRRRDVWLWFLLSATVSLIIGVLAPLVTPLVLASAVRAHDIPRYFHLQSLMTLCWTFARAAAGVLLLIGLVKLARPPRGAPATPPEADPGAPP